MTKSALYARAGVPCCWLVNLRDLCIEVVRQPNREKSDHASVERCIGSPLCPIDAFPEVRIEAAELPPPLDARLP